MKNKHQGRNMLTYHKQENWTPYKTRINYPPPKKNKKEGMSFKWPSESPTQHINQQKYWDAGHFSRDTIPWAGKGGNAGGSTPIEYSANEELGEGDE